ncbi:uncharacterized protein [Typha latifolia]|uniref:uncharacterized protein n=1 Tax=Typha latifolia TaxID=4733 RepID=UPI003C2C8E28
MFHHSSSSSSYEEPLFDLPLNYSAIPLTVPNSPSNGYASFRSLCFSSSLPSSLHFPNPSSSCEYTGPNSASPMRRVSSTGDLQGINGLVASGESCILERGAVAGRVGRYSAEERKERIERYRCKRRQRNFHKKITYACRKTLADSRPRVRGRFARNGEAEVVENSHNYECRSYNGILEDNEEWWRPMEAPLVTDEEEEFYNSEGIWANFADVFSQS